MKAAMKLRGVRIVAGSRCPCRTDGNNLRRVGGSAQRQGEVSASSPELTLARIRSLENADVYGNLRLQVTLDVPIITSVTVLESPGTAAAPAQLAAGNSALAVRIATRPRQSRSASATAQAASAMLQSRRRRPHPRRRRAEKKAAKEARSGCVSEPGSRKCCFGSRECRRSSEVRRRQLRTTQ